LMRLLAAGRGGGASLSCSARVQRWMPMLSSTAGLNRWVCSVCVGVEGDGVCVCVMVDDATGVLQDQVPQQMKAFHEM
jgi:hypothetical protein